MTYFGSTLKKIVKVVFVEFSLSFLKTIWHPHIAFFAVYNKQ